MPRPALRIFIFVGFPWACVLPKFEKVPEIVEFSELGDAIYDPQKLFFGKIDDALKFYDDMMPGKQRERGSVKSLVPTEDESRGQSPIRKQLENKSSKPSVSDLT
jgi:hypothetical protein